jgi:hypothetical protein
VIPTTVKPKTCQHCGTTFHPARMMQKVCGPVCAGRMVKAQKKEKAKQTKLRKEAIKTIPTLKKEAQHAFNAYIRARDQLRPCICCGKNLGSGEVGGHFDAGHYRSTGSADHLRFHEDNCHAQRKQCNRHGAGRAVDYRIGLINRIGLERVEALEADNTSIKWTRELLIQIKATFKQKLKELGNP